MSTPHDTFFGQLFGRLDVATDHLQRLVPATLARTLDWSTLRHEPTVSRDDVGRELRSDIVFSVRGVDHNVHLLHFHLEHQRVADPLMALRMVSYETRIWQGWCEAETQRTGARPKTLPPIVPLVLYNGRGTWDVPTTLEELFVPAHIVPQLGSRHVRGGFQLLDLSAISDEALIARAEHAHARLGLWLLKHIDDPDLWEQLVHWADTAAQIRALSDPLERIGELLRYVASIAGPPPTGTLERFMQDFSEDERQETMTWAETIERRGRDDGLREGRASVVHAQLERKFGPLPSNVVERLAAGTIEDLDTWALRMLDATSLDSVFEDAP